jgi:methionine biosynthesis protein MetW
MVMELIQHRSNLLDAQANEPRLLDIGCGDGRIASQIAKTTKYQVYGLEASPNNVKKCLSKKIIAKVQDVEKKFSFPNNFFDVVFAGEIIEHLLDTKKFLNEINRVLKPNGILILTTPNLAHLPDRIRFLTGKNPTNVSPVHEFLHLHIRPFTYNMLEYALSLTNFKLIHLQSTMVVFKWDGDRVVLSSRMAARLWPTLGNTFVVEAQKIN